MTMPSNILRNLIKKMTQTMRTMRRRLISHLPSRSTKSQIPLPLMSMDLLMVHPLTDLLMTKMLDAILLVTKILMLCLTQRPTTRPPVSSKEDLVLAQRD